MPAFRTPVDVANRALQHCGAKRIATTDFSEVSKNCAEISSCYDKLREFELSDRYWTFSIKRALLRAIDGNTLLLAPSLWASGTTYFVGSIVADENGNLWISNIPNNLGNDPLLTTYWDPYTGPVSVSLYDSTGSTSYSSGELVYTTPGDGTNKVYLSLIDGNTDNPATATAWSSATTYFKNQVVTFSSVAYMSLIDNNINQEPDLAPALWAVGTTYSTGQKVGGSDGMIYSSVGNGNVGNNPVGDGGVHWTNTGVLNPWTTVFTGGAGSVNWLEIGGSDFPNGVALSTLNIVYPLGAGPAPDTFSKNAFLLPAGFLRRAPQNPKTGLIPLGGPSGTYYDDWTIEGRFLISAETGPIPLRFVANITDVSKMHTMFCEGLSLRIGLEVVQPLTQSDGKAKEIAGKYEKFENAAKTIDGIENGWTEAPDDEFISVRA